MECIRGVKAKLAVLLKWQNSFILLCVFIYNQSTLRTLYAVVISLCKCFIHDYPI